MMAVFVKYGNPVWGVALAPSKFFILKMEIGRQNDDILIELSHERV